MKEMSTKEILDSLSILISNDIKYLEHEDSFETKLEYFFTINDDTYNVDIIIEKE